MSDLISRQAAIDAVNTALFPKINTAKDAEKALKALPSAEPERKTGKWVPAFEGKYRGGAYWFNCSECGKIVPGGLSSGKLYCERCGARMDGKK